MSVRLCIDAGNTRLKGALVGEGSWQDLPPLAWRSGGAAPAIERHWQDLPATPARVVCANVAGEPVAAAIARWTRSRWGVETLFVTVQAAACGVRNRYARPEQLGVDRWLAAVAGYRRAGGACVAIDCGTALTAEFVTGAGDYLGGLIAPGPGLMADSLARGTAQLPAIEALRAGTIGDDTASCIAAGVGAAVAGWIAQVTELSRRMLGEQAQGIITGGGLPALAALVPRHFVAVPQLVLEGIALVTEEVR